MKMKLNRVVSSLLTLAMAVNVTVPVLAVSNKEPFDNDEVSAYTEELLDSDYTLDVDQMTPEQRELYQEVMDSAIAEYSAEDADFDPEAFSEEVATILANAEYGIEPLGVKVSVSTKVAATAINVAIVLLTGGVTSAAIKSFVTKVGAQAATNAIAKKVTTILLAMGIKKLTGLDAIIKTIVNGVVNPGQFVASTLDRMDRYPNNGKIDFEIG